MRLFEVVPQESGIKNKDEKVERIWNLHFSCPTASQPMASEPSHLKNIEDSVRNALWVRTEGSFFFFFFLMVRQLFKLLRVFIS